MFISGGVVQELIEVVDRLPIKGAFLNLSNILIIHLLDKTIYLGYTYRKEGDMDKMATYRGIPIEELTKEELIVALNEMAEYYESRLNGKDQIISLYKRHQR